VALLEKLDGSLRTIAVGDVLIRSMTRAGAFSVKEKFSKLLDKTQISVGVKGGAEMITQAFALSEPTIERVAGPLHSPR
jgi:hypothetical protein